MRAFAIALLASATYAISLLEDKDKQGPPKPPMDAKDAPKELKDDSDFEDYTFEMICDDDEGEECDGVMGMLSDLSEKSDVDLDAYDEDACSDPDGCSDDDDLLLAQEYSYGDSSSDESLYVDAATDSQQDGSDDCVDAATVSQQDGSDDAPRCSEKEERKGKGGKKGSGKP